MQLMEFTKINDIKVMINLNAITGISDRIAEAESTPILLTNGLILQVKESYDEIKATFRQYIIRS